MCMYRQKCTEYQTLGASSNLLVCDVREIFDRRGPVVVFLSVSFWVFQIQVKQSGCQGWISSVHIDLNRHVVNTVSCREGTAELKLDCVTVKFK